MTITPEMVKDLRGSEVYDRDDEKIGKVGEVYVDNASGEPKWITVNTGLFGTKETFVPLEGARTGGDGIHVAATKKTVKDAPRSADESGELSESGERDLYRHYGMTPGTAAGTRGQGRGTDARGMDADARDRSASDRSDQHMTLSEERLAVGTESVETGTVRLRKYVVTENQSVEVPVSHEEVRLVREPARGDRAGRTTIGEEEQVVTLHEDRPMVSKETHAVENVRLAKDKVTENRTITDDVRKERVEIDDAQGVLPKDSGRTKK